MLSGSMADRFGRRRVFQLGLGLFHARLAAVQPGPAAWAGWWRSGCVQAVGGSMLNPVALSIITNTFTDPQERARAMASGARCSG